MTLAPRRFEAESVRHDGPDMFVAAPDEMNNKLACCANLAPVTVRPSDGRHFDCDNSRILEETGGGGRSFQASRCQCGGGDPQTPQRRWSAGCQRLGAVVAG
jgi:hypothetical protein